MRTIYHTCKLDTQRMAPSHHHWGEIRASLSADDNKKAMSNKRQIIHLSILSHVNNQPSLTRYIHSQPSRNVDWSNSSHCNVSVSIDRSDAVCGGQVKACSPLVVCRLGPLSPSDAPQATLNPSGGGGAHRSVVGNGIGSSTHHLQSTRDLTRYRSVGL